MSRRDREVEILLREWVRGVIGLEEWTLLGEDTYSRKVDRMVPTDMEPNVSDLALKAKQRPAAAKAEIDAALEKGEGSYERAVKFLDKVPGRKQIHPRTMRRIDQELKGGAKRAAEYREEMKDDGAESEAGPAGWDEDEDLRAEK